MSSQVDPRTPPKPGKVAWQIPAFVIAVVVVLYGTREVAGYIETGKWTAGLPHILVMDMVSGIARGKYKWSGVHTYVAVGFGLLVALSSVLLVVHIGRRPRRSKTRDAARHLGKAESMSLKAVSARSDSSRLTTGPIKGMMICETMGKKNRYVDFRSTGVAIMGTGAGKTTGLSIPMIMDAPGVAFATTNKRDLPDAIRGAKDGKVWVFDPQQLTGTGMPAWRLELSNYVTDEVRAHKLAKIWVDASSPKDAKKDSYFDTAGPNLLAGLLQAAALDKRPISQVYKWLTKPTNQEAVQILRQHGFALPAMALEGVYNAPDEQMGGVFGTASETVSFLNNTRVRSWLEPEGPDDMRPVFSPEDFVRSGNETMLALSKEGIGSTGPLTASLTMWVLDAAEEMADLYAHGRLEIPLTVILDEAANVTPILSLPNLYSHYGSRGIFLFTILQSWAQGVQVWGENGMQAMWDAATFCMVGKGQKNIKFLEMISKLLDDKYVPEHSISPGRNKSLLGGGGRSTSYRLQPIMTVGDLGSMKVFETVVLPSEDKPFVGMLLPWMQRKDLVERVSASIAKYEPQNSVVSA